MTWTDVNLSSGAAVPGNRIGLPSSTQQDRAPAASGQLPGRSGHLRPVRFRAGDHRRVCAHGQLYTQIRTALVRVLSEQAQLAGWAAFDAGFHAEAKRHYSKSLKAAKEARDAALTGNAVAGDVKATEKALEEAKAALMANSDRTEPDWVFWVDDNEIEIMAGRCWAELRRPVRAVSCLDSALSRLDDTQARDKALYMTSLAHALIDGKEIERAALVTQECIRLAHGVGSVRPKTRVNGVLDRLREFRGSTAVTQVLEQPRS